MTRMPFLLPILALALVACGGNNAPAEPVEPTVVDTVTEASPAEPEPMATEPMASEPAAGDSQSTGTVEVLTVIPGESSASYQVDEEFFAGAVERMGQQLGLTDTIGSTQDVSGSMTIRHDATGPVLESGEFVVDISTLASNNDRRDSRIREEWLQSGLFPQATFSPTSLTGLPADAAGEVTFEMAGDLTIREITQPVVFQVVATIGDEQVDAVATTMILMTDFGFNPPSMMNMFTVGDEVTVTLDLSFSRAPTS